MKRRDRERARILAQRKLVKMELESLQKRWKTFRDASEMLRAAFSVKPAACSGEVSCG